jgi:hypothetical protein
MNMRLALSLALGTLVLSPSFTLLGAGFGARRYEPAPDGPAWSSVSALTPSGSGYVVTASGPAPTNQLGTASVSAMGLSAAGEVDWAVWAVEGEMGYTTMKAHPEEPLVFAKVEGLAAEEFWTVFGVYSARDGTPVFERGVRVMVNGSQGHYMPDPVPSVDYLSDGRSAVLLDAGPIVRVAVLGRDGTVEWQKAFSSMVESSFDMAGRGLHSTLVEDPGRGFWLIVEGSKKITTAPNPPAVNAAVTFNVIRLSGAGEIVWAKMISGLQLSGIAPRLLPAAVGPDGSLYLSFLDMVIGGASMNPGPNDFHAYVLALAPDGQLHWARRVRAVGGPGLTPVLSRDGSILYLAGAKLRSTSSLASDGVLLAWAAATGESLAQVGLNSALLDEVTLVGVSEDQVFVRMLSYPQLSPPATVFVAAFNPSLREALWRQLSPGKAPASLAYNGRTGALLLANKPAGESRVEAVELDPHLKELVGGIAAGTSPAACNFLTDASVPTSDPNLAIEKLTLSQGRLLVSSEPTSIPLVATRRIGLNAMQPSATVLCDPPQPAQPEIAGVLDRRTGDFLLRFASRSGAAYALLYARALGEPFEVLATGTGDGQFVERRLRAGEVRAGFYAVRTLASQD